jgi:hypothetical protein
VSEDAGIEPGEGNPVLKKFKLSQKKKKNILKLTADTHNQVNSPMPEVKNRLLRRDKNVFHRDPARFQEAPFEV